MSGMKNKIGLLAALSLMSGIFGSAKNSNNLRPSDIDITPKEPQIPKGCKKYVFKESFGTLEVIAINERSATKKYNKWCAKNSPIK
jgi:hypothetical protein